MIKQDTALDATEHIFSYTAYNIAVAASSVRDDSLSPALDIDHFIPGKKTTSVPTYLGGRGCFG